MWLSYNPAIALLGIYPREIKKLHSPKNLYTYVYNSLIHNSQNNSDIFQWMND